MDHLIIATKTEKDMQQVNKLLQSQFKMKDMGELHYCLEITIKQDKADKTVEITLLRNMDFKIQNQCRLQQTQMQN